MTDPIPASLSASPETLTPAELMMRFAPLTDAATECRIVARDLRKRAVEVSTANGAAAAANPASALAPAATALCGGDLPMAIDNVATFLDRHAEALDRAADIHVATEQVVAADYRQTQPFGPAGSTPSA